LRQIAQDYLAIQGSATLSECAFSCGGITSSLHRGSLSTEIFEALQILKSVYCNGHVAAVDEAGKHIDVLIVALDGISEEDDKDIIEL
jgi:hypothetical protein